MYEFTTAYLYIDGEKFPVKKLEFKTKTKGVYKKLDTNAEIECEVEACAILEKSPPSS
jgi:hypothetical protein